MSQFPNQDPVNDKDLPLPLRKNFRDVETKKQAHIERIKKALGIDVTVVILDDLTKLNEHVKQYQNGGYYNRLGEIFYDWILNGIAALMEEKVASDDMTKEAFIEKLTTKAIGIRVPKFDDGGSWQTEIKFENGMFVVERGSNFIANCDNVKNCKIDSIL